MAQRLRDLMTQAALAGLVALDLCALVHEWRRVRYAKGKSSW